MEPSRPRKATLVLGMLFNPFAPAMLFGRLAVVLVSWSLFRLRARSAE